MQVSTILRCLIHYSTNYIYLQFTINSISVSFFATSWLFASHLYAPLSSLLALKTCNICSSFPVILFTSFPIYHVTFAGGLPPFPLHAHVKLSLVFTVVELEHSTVTIGVTEMQSESHFVRE